MKPIIANTELISKCGLNCGACRAYIKGKCPGCNEKTNAQWCKIRTCVIENNYTTCADCKIADYNTCKKVNNIPAKIISFIFNSDRIACLNYIKTNGIDNFANMMCDKKLVSIKKK